MKYQNYKSDFTSVHTFYRQDGDTKTQIAVPNNVRLTFFTAERCGFVAVRRNGAEMSGCSISADGKTLTACIPLSRKSLGTGELFCEIEETTSETGFPEDERIEVTPVRLGITLWPGKSDDDGEVQSDLVIGIISREVAAVMASCKTATAAAESAASQANAAAASANAAAAAVADDIADLQTSLAANEAAAAANRADIDRLAERQSTPDDRALPLLCGQPPILFGAGTPKESVVPDNWNQYDPQTGEGYNWNGRPSAVGQQYIDTTAQSGGRYVAARDGEWDLKWLNS